MNSAVPIAGTRIEKRTSPRSGTMPRLGYLVPEFPGQTHIFFWRELKMLASMEVDCQIVSTRLPPRKMISHSWSTQAIAQTSYLSPPRAMLILAAIRELLLSGPRGWFRTLFAILRADVGGVKNKLRLFGFAFAGAEVSALARQGKWQHLHVHSCANAAHVALFANLISGLSYSLTLHGPLIDYGPNQAMKWSRAAFGVVITKRLLKEVRSELGKSAPAQIDIAPMGVNTSAFVRTRPFVAWDGEGQFEIFCCGRMHPCKGHDDLIRAVAILRKTGIKARLRIAGADDSLGRYQPILEAVIREERVEEFVDLLGAVSEETVRASLETSHVFALASLREPLGVAIMEAMAMEVPIVATNAGGVPELIDDGIDGLLVPPENPQALAEALRTIASDPQLARSLSVNGRAKVVAQFQADKSARLLAEWLQKSPSI